MNVISAHRNKKWNRSTNYTACTIPLMRRCCLGAHAGPAGISNFHTVVIADFTAQKRSKRAATGYCNQDLLVKCGTIRRLHQTENGACDKRIIE